MGSNPRVSVVMSVYNGALYLPKSLGSLLTQTCQDFEAIIVDDGSTDETPQILSSISDPRIAVVRNLDNRGLIYSLNLGLELARGQYIARQDVDDVAMAHRLEIQARLLDRYPRVGLVGSDYLEVTGLDARSRRIRVPRDCLAIRWHCLFQNPFAHSTVMFRKALVRAQGGYSGSQAALHVEDYELWSRLMWDKVEFANIPTPLVKFRLNPDGVSARNTTAQARNFRAIVQRNMQRLASGLDGQQRDLLWAIQVGGGPEVSPCEVKKLLGDLERMVDAFCDYFSLEARGRRRIRDLATLRAAGTLLHISRCRAYKGRWSEAQEFLDLATGLDRGLLLSSTYWRLRAKMVITPEARARAL